MIKSDFSDQNLDCHLLGDDVDSLVVFMNLMLLTSERKSPEDKKGRFLQKIIAIINVTTR